MKEAIFTKRTRNIRFEEYGIDDEMRAWLLKLCRIDLPEIREMVDRASRLANKGISRWIAKSLTEGLSYIELEKSDDPVPAAQNDFYGYRRKALAIFSVLYTKYIMFGDEAE